MDQPPPAQRAEAMARAMASVGANLAALGVAAAAAMRCFTDNGAGRQLRDLVEHFTAHPEILDQMIADREREGRQVYCHCLCLRWGHLGACTTTATVERTVRAQGHDVTMPLCAPCAAGIDSYRLAHAPVARVVG